MGLDGATLPAEHLLEEVGCSFDGAVNLCLGTQALVGDNPVVRLEPACNEGVFTHIELLASPVIAFEGFEELGILKSTHC